MNVKSFSFRLFLAVLVVLAAVQGFIFLAVNRSNHEISYNAGIDKLKVSAEVFRTLLRDRTNVLIRQGRLISSDYGFKSAYGTRDRDTLVSAMKNHLQRMTGAEFMLLLEEDGGLIASTLSRHEDTWGPLIKAAEATEYGEASRILTLDGRPVQVIIMPFLAPDFEAWLICGFPIGAAFLQELETITRTGIALVDADGRRWTARGGDTPGTPHAQGPPGAGGAASAGPREENGRLVQTVPLSDDPPVYALLGSSMEESMAINERLNSRLVIILLVSLAVSALLVPVLTHRVSRPVRALVNAVRSVLAGRYDTELDLKRGDEFGELSTAFQHMTRMIRFRERTRGVASHIAAPEVAALLLQPDQSRLTPPRKIVCLLSDAFQDCDPTARDATAGRGAGMEALIRRHHGVLARNGRLHVVVFADAGLGEGIAHALALVRELAAPHTQRGGADGPSFSLAAGDALLEQETEDAPPVVTGHVVLRAHQLLLLNAVYGARCVADGRIRTYAPELACRELDTIALAGERESLTLVEPVSFDRDIDADGQARIDRFQEALAAYRRGDLEHAARRFEALLGEDPADRVCAYYLGRARRPWAGGPAFHAAGG